MSDIEWAEDIISQCPSDTAVFIKQVGANPYYCERPVKGHVRKGNDPGLWMASINVRQMPGQRQPA
jgi:hypothetical protein